MFTLVLYWKQDIVNIQKAPPIKRKGFYIHKFIYINLELYNYNIITNY